MSKRKKNDGSGKKRDELQEKKDKIERREEEEGRDPLFWEEPGTKVRGGIADSSGKSEENGETFAIEKQISNGDKSREGRMSDEEFQRRTQEMIAKVEEEMRQEGLLPEGDPAVGGRAESGDPRRAADGDEPVYEATRYPGDVEGEFEEFAEEEQEGDLAVGGYAGSGDPRRAGAEARSGDPRRAEAGSGDPRIAGEADEEEAVMGRPRVMDKVKKVEFCAFLRAGLSRRQAAVEIGCHYSSIFREMKRDRQFTDDVSFAERKGHVRPLLQIIKASQHNWRAAVWLMKHHRPINALSREERLDADRESLQALGELNELWNDAR